MGILNYSYS